MCIEHFPIGFGIMLLYYNMKKRKDDILNKEELVQEKKNLCSNKTKATLFTV